MKVTGVILAGGASSRMGSDKALTVYRNKLMVDYAIETLTPFCDEILISGSNEKLKAYGFEVVPDIYPNCGPLGGLHASLLCAKYNTVLTLPCDMPAVTAAVCERLLHLADGYDAVVPVHAGGKVEPLVACYQKHLAAKMEGAIGLGNFKLHRFLETVNTFYVDMDGADCFKNINTKEDLA